MTVQETANQAARFIEAKDPQSYAEAMDQHFWRHWKPDDIDNDYQKLKSNVNGLVYFAHQAGKNGGAVFDKHLLDELPEGVIVGFLPKQTRALELYDLPDGQLRFDKKKRHSSHNYILLNKNEELLLLRAKS